MDNENSIEGLTSLTPKQLEKEVQERVKNFNGIIDSLSTAHDKKKELWREIYQNAVLDRRNAYIMFTDLYTKVHGMGTEHAIHGQTLSKYMERLTKSNEQLIKLAEIIDDAVAADEDDLLQDEDSVYDQLEGNNES